MSADLHYMYIFCFADITVGFTESAVSVREGQSIEVCAAILEPLGEISDQLTIELDITLPASGMFKNISRALYRHDGM